MSQIIIQQVLQTEPAVYNGSGQYGPYTIYTFPCNATIDGNLLNSVSVKTRSTKIRDRIKPGAVFVCSIDNYNGQVSYMIKLKENDDGSNRSGGQGGRPAGGGGGSRNPAAVYTLAELKELFKECCLYVSQEISKDIKLDPELQSKLTMTLFISARESGAKVCDGPAAPPPGNMTQPELPTNQAAPARPPAETSAIGTPVNGANNKKGLRDYIIALGVPPEKVNFFIKQYKKKEWTTAMFEETIEEWTLSYKWDSELDELVKK